MSSAPADPGCISFTDEDLVLAVRSMESFVDVTPEDLREICRRARACAAARTAAATAPPTVPAATPPCS